MCEKLMSAREVVILVFTPLFYLTQFTVVRFLLPHSLGNSSSCEHCFTCFVTSCTEGFIVLLKQQSADMWKIKISCSLWNRFRNTWKFKQISICTCFPLHEWLLVFVWNFCVKRHTLLSYMLFITPLTLPLSVALPSSNSNNIPL